MALILQAITPLRKPTIKPGLSCTYVNHSVYSDDVLILVIVVLYFMQGVKRKKCCALRFLVVWIGNSKSRKFLLKLRLTIRKNLQVGKITCIMVITLQIKI